MSASERVWVRDLEPGCEVEEVYAVRSKEVRVRRGGGSYLALTLGDRSGQVMALAWENVEQIAARCAVGAVLRVKGRVQRYNQKLQLVVNRVAEVEADGIDESLFVRASSCDPDRLWARLIELVEGVGDPDLRQLLFRIFSDPDVEARFRVSPAARGMHHAYRSGLLEHTVSMTTAVDMLAGHYGVDRDMAVVGALLHDLGKVWELELTPTVEYTDDGRLLGHLSMAVLEIDRHISDLERFPAELRRQLLHIVLAHHGQYEFGSPRRPKTPEALLVHMVDNLDSKLAGMFEAIDGSGQSDEAWSAYSRILERPVYRRRPPTAGNDDD
jgi:3'-5' exoribonuclease